MKRTLTILLFMIMSLPCCSMTLQGGVSYTVETARKEAFDGVVYQIPVSTFSKYLTDPNYAANKKAMKSGQTDLGDRYMALLSNGEYGIVYKKDRLKVYSYNSKGQLDGIGIRNSTVYPVKTYEYNNKGQLETVCFLLSPGDAYTYDVNGTLKYRIIGNKYYDSNGNLMKEKVN